VFLFLSMSDCEDDPAEWAALNQLTQASAASASGKVLATIGFDRAGLRERDSVPGVSPSRLRRANSMKLVMLACFPDRFRDVNSCLASGGIAKSVNFRPAQALPAPR